MKTLVILTAVMVGAALGFANPAHCATCSTFKCYSHVNCDPVGTNHCVCLKEGMDLTGVCVSMD